MVSPSVPCVPPLIQEAGHKTIVPVSTTAPSMALGPVFENMFLTFSTTYIHVGDSMYRMTALLNEGYD